MWLMSKTKQKTMFYKRICWINVAYDMENLMKEAHTALTTTAQRAFEYNDGHIQGSSFETRSNGFLCHVAFFVHTQQASLIPIPSDDKTTETFLLAPPDNKNYLQGDVFFLIKNNHIIVCTSGLAEHAVVVYMRGMLEAVGRSSLAMEFSVESIMNEKKLDVLKEGVKSLSLNTAIYTASVDHHARRVQENSTIADKLVSSIKDVLAEFVITSDESKDIKDKENLSVKVELSFDGRKKGEISKGKLQALASDSLDEEGFTIVTKNDKKITFNEIRLHEKIPLAVSGTSVSKEAAWNSMGAYFNKLKSTGMLE